MFHVLVNNMSMCVSSNQLNMVYVDILCISLQTGLIQMPSCVCIHTEANKKVPTHTYLHSFTTNSISSWWLVAASIRLTSSCVAPSNTLPHHSTTQSPARTSSERERMMSSLSRVSYRGVGALESPPPEILKLGRVIIVVPSILAIYMLLDIHVSMCYQNVVWVVCPRLRQKQSERS